MRFSPSDPRTIYLQDAPTGGSARSRDGGITWTSNPQVFHQGVVDLVADPLHPGIHYVVSQDRVVRYADGHDPKGLLVRPAGVGSVAVSPIQAGLIIVSEPAGSLAISQDLGDTWQRERSLPFGAALAFDGADPDLFYAVGLFGTIRRRFE